MKIIIVGLFIIINIIIIFVQLNNNQNLFNTNSKLDIPSAIILKKGKCNISDFGINDKFLKYYKKQKKKNKQIVKKDIKPKKIYVDGNKFYIKDKIFIYLGELNHKVLFKTKENNLTKFITVNINQSLFENIKLVENNKTALLFKDNNNSYIIQKPFIDIKKYQKDNNVSKK